MKKKMIAAMSAVLISAILSVPAFAAEWKSDAAGWWYQNDDGSYPNNGWTWVEGKCYYFTPNGYCLTDTRTPDGCTVDASGAWTVDGVVQTQADQPDGSAQTDASQAADETVVQVNGLTFTVPTGFVQDTSVQNSTFFFDGSRMMAINIVSQSVPDMEQYGDWIYSLQDIILDTSIEENIGAPSSKSTEQFTTGTWRRYDYADASAMFNVPGSVHAYARLYNAQIQILVFAGNLADLDTNQIMNDNVR